MAARKSSGRSRPQPKTEEVPEQPAEDAGKTDDDAPLDAVIVVKTVNEDGSLGVNVIPNGNVQVTEVQTLLEFGLKSFREQIGLPGQSPR